MPTRNLSAYTGKCKGAGTANAGLVLKSLTTAQRDATTPEAGDIFLNTTTDQVEAYRGAAYRGLAERGANTFTGQQLMMCGTTGDVPLIIRQTGGVAGTDDLQLSHTGALGNVVCGQGHMYVTLTEAKCLNVVAEGSTRVSAGYNGSVNTVAQTSIGIFGWTTSNSSSLAALDTGIERIAAGIVNINTGTPGAGGALQFFERTAPAAGAANSVRIYAVDNGAGKTQLMALFNSGSAVQLAIEP